MQTVITVTAHTRSLENTTIIEVVNKFHALYRNPKIRYFSYYKSPKLCPLNLAQILIKHFIKFIFNIILSHSLYIPSNLFFSRFRIKILYMHSQLSPPRASLAYRVSHDCQEIGELCHLAKYRKKCKEFRLSPRMNSYTLFLKVKICH